MTEGFEDKFGTDGWILSMRDQPESKWGSVDSFYETVEKEDGLVSIHWERNGTYRGNRWGPQVGQGIAFYHNGRAKFPRNDLYNRKPRISLIGKLVKIRRSGRHINYIEATYQKEVLKGLQSSPIIREGSAINLFERCRMVQGNTASYYFAKHDVWSSFLAIISNKI